MACLFNYCSEGNGGTVDGLEIRWKVAEDRTQEVRSPGAVQDAGTLHDSGILPSCMKWSNASERETTTKRFSTVAVCGECSSVGINILPIAVSAKRHTKSIIVEKVYRPPVDKYCIEYPGGLQV